MTSEIVWLAPILILPSLGLLIVSTSARFGTLHDEIHHWLDGAHDSAVIEKAYLVARARHFRNALVVLYSGILVFICASLNNLAAYQRLTQKLQSLLSDIGCHEHLIPEDYYLGTKFPFNLAHQAGTMRFGADPATSVLDLHCKVHGLDNVYVTDAAFMPSVGAVNPSLTIIANVLRVADHLKQEVL